MAYANPYDIANRALLHCETRPITAFTDSSKAANHTARHYDRLRQAELRSRLWKFSLRTLPLKAITSTTKLLTFPAYSSGTTYAQGVVVTDNGYDGNSNYWISLVGSNTANTPKSSPTYWAEYHGQDVAETWSSGATYYIGDVVLKTSTYYISSTDSNTNNDPASGSPWLTLTGTTGATLFTPTSLTANRNATTLYAYRLPLNHLRVAPQDPKAAGTTYSATSAGMQYSNFEFRGKYIITPDASPLIYRFAADIHNVPDFDPIFSELLAARLGMAICGIMTQKPQLKQQIEQEYQALMAQAARINAIEGGNTEELEEGYKVSRDPEDMGIPAPQGR